jgi:hypothetical protein
MCTSFVLSCCSNTMAAITSSHNESPGQLARNSGACPCSQERHLQGGKANRKWKQLPSRPVAKA